MFVAFRRWLKNPAVRVGLIGGILVSLTMIVGYIVIPAPANINSGITLAIEVGARFFNRPIWHHVLIVVLPSMVVAAASTWHLLHRRINTNQSDVRKCLLIQILSPAVAISIYGVILPIFWGIGLATNYDAELHANEIGEILRFTAMWVGITIPFVFFLLITIVPALIVLTSSGIAAGYLTAESINRIR